MRAQVSTELLIIIGFVTLLFISLMLFVYYKTAELNSGIEGLQSRLLTSKLAFIANSLGWMGEGSALKIEFMLPQTAKILEFRPLGTGGEVIITLNDGTQISQLTAFALEAKNYSGGNSYKLEFRSENGRINISSSG